MLRISGAAACAVFCVAAGCSSGNEAESTPTTLPSSVPNVGSTQLDGPPLPTGAPATEVPAAELGGSEQAAVFATDLGMVDPLGESVPGDGSELVVSWLRSNEGAEYIAFLRTVDGVWRAPGPDTCALVIRELEARASPSELGEALDEIAGLATHEVFLNVVSTSLVFLADCEPGSMAAGDLAFAWAVAANHIESAGVDL